MDNFNITVGDDYSTFNGSSSYAECDDFLETTPSKNKVSIVAWINCANHIGVVISHEDSGSPVYSPSWALTTHSSNLFRGWVSNGQYGTPRKDYYSSLEAQDNTWHLIAFTFDVGTFKLYMDNSEDPNPDKSSDDSFSTIYDSIVKFIIGSERFGGVLSSYFNGKISKAYIFDGVITLDDIIYLHGLGH